MSNYFRICENYFLNCRNYITLLVHVCMVIMNGDTRESNKISNQVCVSIIKGMNDGCSPVHIRRQFSSPEHKFLQDSQNNEQAEKDNTIAPINLLKTRKKISAI